MAPEERDRGGRLGAEQASIDYQLSASKG
jgi:hypothetical protein